MGNYCPVLCLLRSHPLSLCVLHQTLSGSLRSLWSFTLRTRRSWRRTSRGTEAALLRWPLWKAAGRLMAFLLVSAGICCASSWGRTSPRAGCPAPSSHTLCWAPTPCRRSSGTTTPRSIVWTTSQTSSSPQTRPRSWRRRWWSCTSPTGLTTVLYSITEVIWRGVTGIETQLNVLI